MSKSRSNVLHILLTATAVLLAFVLTAAILVPGVYVRAEESTGGDTEEVGDEVTVVSISVSETEITLKEGETYAMKVTAKMSDDSTKDAEGLTFTSDNADAATVNENGVITAVAEGEAVITAKGETEDIKCTIKVTVTKGAAPTVVSIKADVEELTLAAGETHSLIITATMSDNTTAMITGLTFTSDNADAVTVDENGVITAVAPGEAVITVASGTDDISCTCRVTVSAPETHVVSISVSEEQIRIGTSDKYTLKVTAEMSDGTTKDAEGLTFTSSDDEVASVDESGVITAHKSGKVEITIKGESDEISCVCKVTVSDSNIRFETLPSTGERVATGFNPGVTVAKTISDLAAAENIAPESITVLNAEGAVAADSMRMGTGMTLTVEDSSYMVVVLGDTDGNGVINNKDVKAILDYLTGASHLLDSRANNLAAQVIKGKNDVTIENALFLQRHLYGLENITQ